MSGPRRTPPSHGRAQLDRKDLKAKWAQEVERVGALVQVWPLEGPRLVAWLGERLAAAGFQPAPGVAALLAERVEGNLLAAVQEVEKLRLLRDPGPLDEAGLLAAICDNARFDLFDLTDAALAGTAPGLPESSGGLAGEGIAPPLVLWVLARELRTARRGGLRPDPGARPCPDPGRATGAGDAPCGDPACPAAPPPGPGPGPAAAAAPTRTGPSRGSPAPTPG